MTAIMDVLRTPYRLGGRTVGVELDCLGVVGEIARRRGLPPPDGWPSILRDFADHGAASGFPRGWQRVDARLALQDGDVLVLAGAHPGCAIVHEGLVVTANPDAGCHAVPLNRWLKSPVELWRWQP